MPTPTGINFTDQAGLPRLPRKGQGLSSALTESYFRQLHRAIDPASDAGSTPTQLLAAMATPIRCHNPTGNSIPALSAVEITGQVTGKAFVNVARPSAAGGQNIAFAIQGIPLRTSGTVYVAGVHLCRYTQGGTFGQYYTVERNDYRLILVEAGQFVNILPLVDVGWLSDDGPYGFFVDRGPRDSIFVVE